MIVVNFIVENIIVCARVYNHVHNILRKCEKNAIFDLVPWTCTFHISQGWHPNANLVVFSSLKNTNDMIQPQILGTVVGHLTFAAFIKIA